MRSSSPSDINWHKCNTQVFWGEMAPCNHLLQIYENDEVVLGSLMGFVSSGFDTGDAVILIATKSHLNKLLLRLSKQGYDMDELIRSEQYFPLVAEEILSKFMYNNWPDEHLFLQVVENILVRARGKQNRRVRAFGEMVAILWEQGNSGATVQLEHLWNKFCEKESFCLFCAYPKSGFTRDMNNSLIHICSAHTRLIAGDVQSTTEVFYKSA